MATGAKAGRIALVAVGATTSSMTEVGEVRNWRITPTHRPIDATSNDSSGWDEFIGGQRGFTMTGEAMNIAANAPQVLIRKMMSSQAAKYFQLRPSTALTQKWVGAGHLQNFEVGGNHDNVQLFNWSIQGTGVLSHTT